MEAHLYHGPDGKYYVRITDGDEDIEESPHFVHGSDAILWLEETYPDTPVADQN